MSVGGAQFCTYTDACKPGCLLFVDDALNDASVNIDDCTPIA